MLCCFLIKIQLFFKMFIQFSNGKPSSNFSMEPKPQDGKEKHIQTQKNMFEQFPFGRAPYKEMSGFYIGLLPSPQPQFPIPMPPLRLSPGPAVTSSHRLMFECFQFSKVDTNVSVSMMPSHILKSRRDCFHVRSLVIPRKVLICSDPQFLYQSCENNCSYSSGQIVIREDR